jgi:hypothetical protein
MQSDARRASQDAIAILDVSILHSVFSGGNIGAPLCESSASAQSLQPTFGTKRLELVEKGIINRALIARSSRIG